MRLFIRDQVPLLFCYFLQLGSFFLILWLDEYRHPFVFLYAVLISGLILLIYLTYRYIRLYSFYQLLLAPPDSLEETIKSRRTAPLASALNELLLTQYGLYKGQLHQFENQMNRHFTFLVQWVHQMKTPLSVIYLLLHEERRSSPYREILHEANRIREGMEIILHTARLDYMEKDMRVEPVSLDELIKQVLQENKQLFFQNKVFPELHQEGSFVVHSDKKWIAFIFLQIITNAVRYSKGSKKIRISTFAEDTEAVLEVKDFGIGIPPEDLPRVFEPYFTGEKGREYRESTGMGLYLVREACKYLGHNVRIDSKRDEGTRVQIRFSHERSYLTKM